MEAYKILLPKSCIRDKVTIELGLTKDDLKLNADFLLCFIVLRSAETPIETTPFVFILLALNGVSPSKTKRSFSSISAVEILIR